LVLVFVLGLVGHAQAGWFCKKKPAQVAQQRRVAQAQLLQQQKKLQQLQEQCRRLAQAANARINDVYNHVANCDARVNEEADRLLAQLDQEILLGF
jgi:uncharacterized protein YlxW (UPF0749 family)